MSLAVSEASLLQQRSGPPRSAPSDGAGLAYGLAAFSLALGLTELAFPRHVARSVGVREDPDTRLVLRAAGVRELTSGLGILTHMGSPGWLWSRVVGDAMDLTLLALAGSSPSTRRGRTALAAAAVLGVTLLDIGCAVALERASHAAPRAFPEAIGGARQAGSLR
jgi:hypothetical protein